MSAIVLTLNPRNRIELATTIERLIDMLDAVELDPDLEDGADSEPSLGWSDFEGRYGRYDEADGNDRELDLADDEDGGDDEPEETDQNGDELDFNGDERDIDDGECDAPIYIIGGGEADIVPARLA